MLVRVGAATHREDHVIYDAYTKSIASRTHWCAGLPTSTWRSPRIEAVKVGRIDIAHLIVIAATNKIKTTPHRDGGQTASGSR